MIYTGKGARGTWSVFYIIDVLIYLTLIGSGVRYVYLTLIGSGVLYVLFPYRTPTTKMEGSLIAWSTSMRNQLTNVENAWTI